MLKSKSSFLNFRMQSFNTRDEQEVAGYAEAMDLVFQAFDDVRLTENHIFQLHQTLLRHSIKEERHRGSYKTLCNDVVAFDTDGREALDEHGLRGFITGAALWADVIGGVSVSILPSQKYGQEMSISLDVEDACDQNSVKT